MSRPRSGMSLVEVMAAIGANAVLAGVAVVALASLSRADRDVNARLDDRTALMQFAEQLRADVHAAETIDWDEQNRVLRLSSSPGDAIEYRVVKSQWSRHLAGSGNAEAQLSSAFRLPSSFSVEFDPGEAEAGEVVRVRLRAATSQSNVPSRARDEEFIIEVGRDSRLLHE